MTQPSQADILAALQAQSGSRKVRPPTTLLSEHEKDGGSPKDLLKGNPGESSKKTNAGKIFCWREGCGCLILSPGVGEWLEDEPNIIPDISGSPFPSSSTSTDPEKPSTTRVWHVDGSPMSFENIGFSKTTDTHLPSASLGGKKVKWLSCADCDLGPVGWTYEGNTEAWLVADRVRYG